MVVTAELVAAAARNWREGGGACLISSEGR